ncbi:hypothetical protein ACFQVC_15075 [Streptomyces monticola]|uniref:Uncharacterized protein n=1 Tax=Streptomyces monticola TaxID=2666263 RepID=A0ABW2JJ53_9ACTN
MKRLLAAVGVTAAAGVVPVVAAAPAQADQMDCAQYLKGAGYVVGSKAKGACRVGSQGGPVNWMGCDARLVTIGVSSAHSTRACNWSQR